MTTINQQGDLDKALLEAVIHREIELITPLVEQGATPNAVDEGGNTALHHAALQGRISLELLQRLCPKQKDFDRQNNAGKTPRELFETHKKTWNQFYSEYAESNENNPIIQNLELKIGFVLSVFFTIVLVPIIPYPITSMQMLFTIGFMWLFSFTYLAFNIAPMLETVISAASARYNIHELEEANQELMHQFDMAMKVALANSDVVIIEIGDAPQNSYKTIANATIIEIDGEEVSPTSDRKDNTALVCSSSFHSPSGKIDIDLPPSAGGNSTNTFTLKCSK